MVKTTSDWTKKMCRSPNDYVAVKKGCYFDLDAALRVRYFFGNFLCHSKGKFKGQPFKLLDWQWKEFIAPVFGWKKKDGTRRFRKAYLEIPKKNGKSTISAGIALYLLLADDEAGAEVYSLAGDKEQASIVYNEAVSMVQSSDALSERLLVIKSKKMLDYPDTNSIYRVLSSDASTKEGYNVSGLIFDEYHVQKNDDLRDVLEYSGASREQPLFVFITTAGEDTESPCYKEREYAKAVIAGDIDDISYYGLIYSLDEEKEDWTKEKNWYKANPSLGVTIPIDSFREDYKNVCRNPRKAGKFKRYRLNIWTNQESKWLDLNDWAECTYDEVPEPGEECYASIDLATSQDINSLTLFFPERKAIIPFFWVPEGCNLKRVEDHKFRYTGFIEDGLMVEVPGKIMDYDLIFDKVVEMGSVYNIIKIGCDPYNASTLCKRLTEENFEVVYYRQNFANLSNPSKQLENMILTHTIRHYNHRVLNWMIKNVVSIEDKMENIRPCKKKSKEKIDGVVTTIMNIGLWLNDEFGGEPRITILEGDKKDGKAK